MAGHGRQCQRRIDLCWVFRDEEKFYKSVIQRWSFQGRGGATVSHSLLSDGLRMRSAESQRRLHGHVVWEQKQEKERDRHTGARGRRRKSPGQEAFSAPLRWRGLPLILSPYHVMGTSSLRLPPPPPPATISCLCTWLMSTTTISRAGFTST